VIGFPANIVSQQFNMTANPITGVVAGAVFGNNQISCGNIQSTRWVPGARKSYQEPQTTGPLHQIGGFLHGAGENHENL
jgi:hypothetical protein